MRCPKCGSEEKVKNGKRGEKQRYLCKGCGCNYTKSSSYHYSLEERRRAINMYMDGNGFRAIERQLGIPHVTVMRWVRSLGEKIQRLKDSGPKKVSVMELDEMWHYIGKKK